jgi:hypothetical protein
LQAVIKASNPISTLCGTTLGRTGMSNRNPVDQAIQDHIGLFRKPGVPTVRPGYKIKDGWITPQHAAVVTVILPPRESGGQGDGGSWGLRPVEDVRQGRG